VKELAKRIVSRPLSLATTVPVPSAIAAVLKEASLAAVEQVEEAMHNNNKSSTNINKTASIKRSGKVDSTRSSLAEESNKEMIESIVDDAFAPLEASLAAMEASLQEAKGSLQTAKLQSYEAIEAIQMAAMAQAEGAATAVAQVEKEAQRQVMAEIYGNAVAGEQGEKVDISKLTFDDVDYDSSEMAPPFLDPDSCLVPGEPVVRVEKAPENSRRIFAGIDILASVDDVWNVSWFFHREEQFWGLVMHYLILFCVIFFLSFFLS
jgi:nucleoid-associated protein YgaU